MGYPGRRNIYEAAIRKMVTQALEIQEQEFRQMHENDTDEQLLAYLRSCAFRLNHSPWPGEITGGTLIEARFGTWSRALALARLPAPRTPNQRSSFIRVKEEEARQKELYRQKKSEKKLRVQVKRAQQSEK